MENKINNYSRQIVENLKQHDKSLNLKELKGKIIIFVIDMINGFVQEGNLSSPEIKTIVSPIKNFLNQAIKEKIEIIALNDAHSQNNPEFNNYPIHCLENSKEADLVTELQFPEIKIIKKNSTNGFFNLDLSKLEAYENIIITGCCTDICIYQFALSCKTWYNQQNKNVNVIVSKSMTATFDSSNHPSDVVNAIAWNSMIKNGIIIVREIN
ncbi:MAG: isochorismatase family cysteine hydrolase [Spiroplasma sp.]